MSILLVNASARSAAESKSRQIAQRLADGLAKKTGLAVVTRDVAKLAPVDAAFAEATFLPAPTPAQQAALAFSDELVAELKAAEVVVIGTSTYNFGPAAGLKSWADHIARMGVTFRYGDDGRPVGMLEGKRTFCVVASGGTPMRSGRDHVTPWLDTFLPFVGLSGAEFVSTAGGTDEVMAAAEKAADALVSSF